MTLMVNSKARSVHVVEPKFPEATWSFQRQGHGGWGGFF